MEMATEIRVWQIVERALRSACACVPGTLLALTGCGGPPAAQAPAARAPVASISPPSAECPTPEPPQPPAVEPSAQPETPTPATGPCEVGSVVAEDSLVNPVAGKFSGGDAEERAAILRCGEMQQDRWALVQRVAAGWKVAYVDEPLLRHVRQHDCTALRTEYHYDLLVCSFTTPSYGVVYQSVGTIGYQGLRRREDQLVGVADTVGNACGADKVTQVVFARIDDVAIGDHDRDGRQDVRVTLRAAQRHAPPSPSCEILGWGGANKPPKVTPPPAQSLLFVQAFGRLIPNAQSVRVVQSLEKMLP
jgi:hypothetical protein